LKRCPQRNRVEADDALVFCRSDGTPLVSSLSASGPIASESSTAHFDASEVHTSILPHNTDANVNRGTGPTTALPVQPSTATTQELRDKSKGQSNLLVDIHFL
jgi:hypothetical protein